MKKFIFAVVALLAVSMMFTACGKKDEAKDEPVSQTQNADDKAAAQVTEKEANTEENKAESKEADAESAAPITDEDGNPIKPEDFENLVDTFNNTEYE